jgi:5-(carboxyamino)imidazole ribonucleotide synthase
MNPLKQKIGIIGGGQLGKMMILEAKKMDFDVTILDPNADCPAASIADQHLVADFDDPQALQELAQQTDLVTYEFEHIGVEVLQQLEREGYNVYPTPKSLAIIQNKYDQKQLLKQVNLSVPEYIKVTGEQELKQAAEKFGYPFMLKSCKGGYDGKGNALIETQAELEAGYQSLGAGEKLLMAEEYIPFSKEISVIACRGLDGELVTYPIGENRHRDNILRTTKVPAAISEDVAEQALKLGTEVMKVFSGVGIFCIEMFVTETGQVLINEIAPRPHNSGHYSIEGCVTSQFENHIRAVAGLPLGSTQLVRPAVMKNLLGAVEKEAPAQVVGFKEALELPNVKVHVYGKKMVRPERKMGHLTATGDDLEEAKQQAEKAYQEVEITAERRDK